MACHLVNTEQRSGKPRAFTIKSFYKNYHDPVPSAKTIQIAVTNF